MSIAFFDSEREARSWYNKHLLKYHGVNLTALDVRLSSLQLSLLHDTLHLDGYQHPPHSHVAGPDYPTVIQETFDKEYLKDVIEIIMGDEE